MKNSTLLLTLLIVILVLLAIVFFIPYHPFNSNINNSNVAPTSTASETVSTAGNPDSWVSGTSAGLNFKYPKFLGTDYIRAVDWPPSIQVLAEPYSCHDGGTNTEPPGLTKSQTINGRAYCVTEETGGAAGSIYHSYAYATSRGNGQIILTFSLQYPQCVNYDSPRNSACQSEEDSFNISGTVDQIVNSIS